MAVFGNPYDRIGRAMRAMQRPALPDRDALYRDYAADRDVYNRTWKPTPYEPRQAEVEQVAEDLGVDLDTARQIIRDVSSGGGDDQTGWQNEGFAISRTYSNAISQSPLLADIAKTFTKIGQPETWSKPQPAALTEPATPQNRAQRAAPSIDERDLAREQAAANRAQGLQDMGRMRGEEQMAMPSMMAEADRMQSIEDSQSALRAEMEAQAMMAEENARMAAIEDSQFAATRAMEGLAAQSPRGVTEGDFRTGPALVGTRRADLAPLDVPSIPSVARETIGNIPGSLASRMAAEQAGRLGQFAAPGLPQSIGVLEGMRLGQVPVNVGIEDDVAPPSLIGAPMEVSRRAGQFASPDLAAARARAVAQDVEDYGVPGPNMEAANAARAYAAAQLAEEMGIPGIDLATGLEAVAADMARQNALAAADVQEASIPSNPFGVNNVAGVVEAGIPTQAFALNEVADVEEAGIPTRGFAPNNVAGVREADIPSYEAAPDFSIPGPNMAAANAAQSFAASRDVTDFGVPGPNLGLGNLAQAAQAAQNADEFDVPAPNMQSARVTNNAAAARMAQEFGVPAPGRGLGSIGDPVSELEQAVAEPQETEATIVDVTGKRTGIGRLTGPVQTIVVHDEAPDSNQGAKSVAVDRTEGDNIKSYHITFDDKGVYIHVPLNRMAPHAMAFNDKSISVARRGALYNPGVRTRDVGPKGKPDQVKPLTPAERRNAAIALGIAMRATGLGPDSIRTHSELGPTGTATSRSVDEGHWRAEALAELEKNKVAIEPILKNNPVAQRAQNDFATRKEPPKPRNAPPTRDELRERTQSILPPSPQQRSSLDALQQLFADLNPFGVPSAQAAGSFLGEGMFGEDEAGDDDQSGDLVGNNSVESAAPIPLPALLAGLGVTGTGVSAGPGAGAGIAGTAGEGGGSGGSDGLGTLQGLPGIGVGGQIGTNGIATAIPEMGGNRGTIESATGQSIGPGTFGAPGNPGGGGSSGGGVGGRAGTVAGSASTAPASQDVTRGELNDVQGVREADIPSVAPPASAFAKQAPAVDFNLVTEDDLDPATRSVVAGARQASQRADARATLAQAANVPTMTGLAIDREGNVTAARDVRGYARVGIPGTHVVGNLTAPLSATVNTAGPFAGLALSAVADPEAEEPSYAPYSVVEDVNFGNMVAGVPAGMVPGVIATISEDMEAPVADLTVNPNAPFAGVALGQQALESGLAALSSSFGNQPSTGSYGVQSEDTTEADPDGGLPGGQTAAQTMAEQAATLGSLGNEQDGPGTTDPSTGSTTGETSPGGGDGNTPGTETTNYGEMGFGVFGGDGGQSNDTSGTGGGSGTGTGGGTGGYGGSTDGQTGGGYSEGSGPGGPADSGLGSSSPADGESTSGGPMADGGRVKAPAQYKAIVERALRAARRSRAA